MIRLMPKHVSQINNIVYKRFLSIPRVKLSSHQNTPSNTAIIQSSTPSPPTTQWSRQQFIKPRYIGPVVFGLTFTTASFVTAATVYDRNQKDLWDYIHKYSIRANRLLGGSTTEQSLTNQFWIEKRDYLMEKKKITLQKIAERLDNLSLPLDVKRAVWMVGEKFTSLTESEKTLAGIIAINAVVFGMWQIPRLVPFMSKWFLHAPAGPRNITMLTSCFSHQEFFHFALNMVGLWSFGKLVHDALGREQFLALYLSMGVGANVVSHVCSLAIRNSRPLLPSLGASGAIYGLLSSFAILRPDASIALIFLPMLPIKIGTALPALMSIDLAGIILKWRRFDHFAHLAGASMGLGYMYYGEKNIYYPLLQKVHQIRKEYNSKRGGKGDDGGYMWTEPRQSEQSRWSGWFKK